MGLRALIPGLSSRRRGHRAPAHDLTLSREEWYARINASPTERDKIAAELRALGLTVESRSVDLGEFEGWCQRHDHVVPKPDPVTLPPDIARLSGGLRREKLLEYFLSTKLAALGPGRRVADLGSAESSFLDLVVKDYGCEGWAVDPALAALPKPSDPRLHHVPHLVSAARTQLPTLDLIALHCSFEMFTPREMTAVLDLAESSLSPEGLLVVSPLYLADTRTVYSDAALPVPEPNDTVPTLRVGVKDYWSLPWSEWHSAGTLFDRLVRPHPQLSLTIHEIDNAHSVHPGCFLRYVGVWRRK